MKKTIIVGLVLIMLFLFFGCTQTQGDFMKIENNLVKEIVVYALLGLGIFFFMMQL